MLTSNQGSAWVRDSRCDEHLIWFQESPEWHWDVPVEKPTDDWHPMWRWVWANGPQLPQHELWEITNGHAMSPIGTIGIEELSCNSQAWSDSDVDVTKEG